ncbi:Hypothetical protein CINCED_3A006537 [Cinara cedri]|uniref:Type VII secretion system protein EssD-like domain-containing protein n=1 Tax=Cinara cedri TaxID=506608 RepID=A0A5E4MUQ7_9HEMI|nr:Hypothetical protein CINCED_3A006537 [Cinara cedri]
MYSMFYIYGLGYFFSNVKIVVFLAVICITSSITALLVDCPFDGKPDDPSFAYKSIDPGIEQDHIFYHDKYHKTVRMCANITTIYKNKKRDGLDSNLNKVFSAQFRDMDRGHITPHRYGGTYSSKNIIAQNPRLNRVTWNQFENQISILLQTWPYVYYTVRLIYGECDNSDVFCCPDTLNGIIYNADTIYDEIKASNPRGSKRSEIKYPKYISSINERELQLKSNTSEFYSIVGVKSATIRPECIGSGICFGVHDSTAQCLRCCGTLSREHHCIDIYVAEDSKCYQCVSGRRDIYSL